MCSDGLQDSANVSNDHHHVLCWGFYSLYFYFYFYIAHLGPLYLSLVLLCLSFLARGYQQHHFLPGDPHDLILGTD